MLSSRIRCHFCGSRSPYSKSSHISNFQCISCEAVNYLDKQGNIVDTPASMIARAEQSSHRTAPLQTFTKPLLETLNHQRNQSFCTTCLHNQRVYLEVLSNYLPHDNHPKYQEYEDALPKFKEELANKYPQVCKKCAPKAQMKINRADYYASTERIAQALRDTKMGARAGPAGRRDDWWKWSARLVLNIVGLAAYIAVLAQVAWHILGVVASLTSFAADDTGAIDYAFEATPRDCLQQTLRMRLESSCEQMLVTYVARALLVSTCLLWYNPGLKHWYHGTFRMEAITGQTEYFRMQLITLLGRSVAWYKLSDPTSTSNMTTVQIAAAHSFMVAFLLVTRWVSNRQVGYIRFSANTKIMPRPDEINILGASAGPADERLPGQASSVSPLQLLARDRTAPFPIANLAPKQHARTSTFVANIPSPPNSQEDDEGTNIIGDAMEIDWESSPRPQMPGTLVDRTNHTNTVQPKRQPKVARGGYNDRLTQGSGWTGMRSELFGIDDSLSAEAGRKRAEEATKPKLRYQPPTEPNPFRGRLPQAPMSMERRLRNPVSQVQPFKMTPLSKQQDFLKQMRTGILQGKTFSSDSGPKQHSANTTLDPHSNNDDETDEEFSPAKSRTRGGLELKESGWRLASDVAQATGLEDLFGGTGFRIVDEPDVSSGTPTVRSWGHNTWGAAAKMAVVGLLLALVVTVGWNVQPVKRAVCLWLVARLNDMGV